jgi:hypothetical protein
MNSLSLTLQEKRKFSCHSLLPRHIRSVSLIMNSKIILLCIGIGRGTSTDLGFNSKINFSRPKEMRAQRHWSMGLNSEASKSHHFHLQLSSRLYSVLTPKKRTQLLETTTNPQSYPTPTLIITHSSDNTYLLQHRSYSFLSSTLSQAIGCHRFGID